MALLTNIFFWIILSFFLILVIFVLIFVLILLGRWTHAIKEFKARISGKPLSIFFNDNRTCDWQTIKPEAGVITSKNYGSYIINEKGTYIDKVTRNIIIPFSSDVAVGAPVRSFRVADSLRKVLGDEKELARIRAALADGKLDDERFDTLKESIDFSSLKSMLNTVLPHNITAKINMSIAQGLKGYMTMDWRQIGIAMAMIAGAVGLIALVLYLTIGGRGGGGGPGLLESAGNVIAANASNILS